MKGAAMREGTAAESGNETAARDLRLDFFRGLALWFIFVNHIPADQISWATPRNLG